MTMRGDLNLIEPDKMWMGAGVHHSDLAQKHLQHQSSFFFGSIKKTPILIATGKKESSPNRQAKRIYQKFYTFVANICLFRQPFILCVCVKSGDSCAGAGLLLQPQTLMSCGIGMSFFTQTPAPSSQCSIHESEFALRPFQL